MDTLAELAHTAPGPRTAFHSRLQLVGYLAYFGLMGVLAAMVWRAIQVNPMPVWLFVVVAIAAYLAADLLSGVVHFLADNFGTPETPFVGPGFVLPFREHHRDPKGITRHGFFEANGNNALVCLPVLIPTVVLVPVMETRLGFLTGLFVLVLLLAAFLTNQVHKWAHQDLPPAPVRALQRAGLIISKDHHDRHHTSPHDTYYCITVGLWNPLFERYRVFARLERFLRRWVPGVDARTRVEQEMRDARSAQAS
ncbi:MAG: fatty acid desaturase CarF family protein [Gemmatimonadaceae bacterium]